MDPIFVTSTILVLLFSVILHEVMHGWVARRYGDHTAENAGRLTLNPIPHIDPIGTILLPLILILSGSPFLFGWAKPVPVNPLNFRNIKRGEIAVSLAGIGANLFLALVGAVLIHLLLAFWVNPLLIRVASFMVTINLVLAFFNLIPIPPLDGSRVVMAMAPYEIARKFAAVERYGFVILLGLMMIPFGGSTLIGTYLGICVGLGRMLLGL
jgi:Zn-dependent protease